MFKAPTRAVREGGAAFVTTPTNLGDVDVGGRDCLLTIAEAAGFLRVSTKSIRRLIGRGELRAVRIGRAIRIDPESLRRLVFGLPK
jgi:excisionase family DNA binding protein